MTRRRRFGSCGFSSRREARAAGRAARGSADAYLLIGDEALVATARAARAAQFDLAEEWRRQRLPSCSRFGSCGRTCRRITARRRAVRVVAFGVATTAGPGGSPGVIAPIAAAYAFGSRPRSTLGSAERLARYLARFTYRFGPSEEAAIARFRALLDEHRIACDAS